MKKIIENFIIPPKSARAFSLCAGQAARIEDSAGRQPGDFVAFKHEQHSIKLSQARSRVENGKTFATLGDTLWSNTFPPAVMLRITEDTHGGHDLLYAPCCKYALEKRFGTTGNGCLENLAEALAPWNIAAQDIPDPLNLFFNVAVNAQGSMTIAQASSKPGSAITLKAEMDCLVAISTCPVPIQGKESSGYCVRIIKPSL